MGRKESLVHLYAERDKLIELFVTEELYTEDV